MTWEVNVRLKEAPLVEIIDEWPKQLTRPTSFGAGKEALASFNLAWIERGQAFDQRG